MAKLSINKVRNLKQKDEIWEVVVRPARTWVRSRKEDPYRPWYVLVISNEDKIIRHDMAKDKPSTQELSESIFRAMRRPMLGSGRKRRPAKILFDDQEIYDEISPILAEIEVESEKKIALIHANSLLKELDRKFSKDDDIAPLMGISSVTVPLLGKIFEAAAAYYRLAPWGLVPAEEFAMEIRYPADAEPRYAIIIGYAGESFGLSINDSWDDLKAFIKHAHFNSPMPSKLSTMSFTFKGNFFLSFDDLDAIETYGWDIPDEKAYPSIMRYSTKNDFQPPTPKDIYWLEGALPAITEFFTDDYDPDEFLLNFGKNQIEYNTIVHTLGGVEHVKITLPILIE